MFPCVNIKITVYVINSFFSPLAEFSPVMIFVEYIKRDDVIAYETFLPVLNQHCNLIVFTKPQRSIRFYIIGVKKKKKNY